MRILAVDDDPFIVELIPRMSAGIGFPNVVTASSGSEALDAIAAADLPFDCLLVDAGLPGNNGVPLCSSIRAIPAYRKVPIIMLTATEDEAFIDCAFRSGATDHVTKPLDRAELGARMQTAAAINIAQRMAASVVAMRHPDQERGYIFDLSEKTSSRGAGVVVDYTTLTSHLTEMTEAGVMASQVVAVKIDQIDQILARASSEEFLYALTETAEAIGEVFRAFGCLMAYAGRGTFVVVSGKAHLEPSILVESEVQRRLDERNLEYDNGDPLDVDVSIGNPIRPPVTRIRRIARTCDRAIARAESRANRKLKELRPLSDRRVG